MHLRMVLHACSISLFEMVSGGAIRIAEELNKNQSVITPFSAHREIIFLFSFLVTLYNGFNQTVPDYICIVQFYNIDAIHFL